MRFLMHQIEKHNCITIMDSLNDFYKYGLRLSMQKKKPVLKSEEKKGNLADFI